MDQFWRVIILGGWLLILWTMETVFPLKQNNRRHLLTNLTLTGSTILINLLLIFVLLAVINFCYNHYVGLFIYFELPFVWQVIISLLVFDFFAAYVSHRVMHKYELLWRFHQIHHLDEMIDVTTGLRQHPLETVFRFIFLLVGVVLLGASFSVVVIYQSVSSFNALLEHANIKVNSRWDKWLSLVFITPNFHKIHHSINVDHHDSNYSNIFSFWDRLFGTYRKVDNLNELTYGLKNSKPSPAKESAIMKLLGLPFSRSGQ